MLALRSYLLFVDNQMNNNLLWIIIVISLCTTNLNQCMHWKLLTSFISIRLLEIFDLTSWHVSVTICSLICDSICENPEWSHKPNYSVQSIIIKTCFIKNVQHFNGDNDWVVVTLIYKNCIPSYVFPNMWGVRKSYYCFHIVMYLLITGICSCVVKTCIFITF